MGLENGGGGGVGALIETLVGCSVRFLRPFYLDQNK